MRVNLAKVVPWLGFGFILLVWIAAQSSAGDDVDDYGYDAGYLADTDRADAYLDRVAVELARPGLYVDPAVLERGELSASDVARLDELAADTPGPVRVAVLPADELREGEPEDSYRSFAYTEDELVGQLYDRVGVDGTYAILVDADSSYEGRSFTAYQWSEERPFYEVEEAVDAAVTCCAPDYAEMLTAFLERAGEEQTNWWVVLGWVAGVGALGVALLVGGRRWWRWRTRRREDAQVADMLRPALQEEVVELSHTVAALPPPGPAGDDLATRTRRVLDLVEEARQRLDGTGADVGPMDTPAEVEDVVRRLADARYELVAIDALRRGEPVPARTAPCFFDPRHGPSVDRRPFTPLGGSEREVPVCAACRAQVDRGEQPEPRPLRQGGLVRAYWDWDRYTRPYVNGYWQRETFADPRVERQRREPARAVSRGDGPGWGGIQFVWESSGGSGGGSGGGGSSWWSGGGGGGSGRSFAGSSGSRRSFGGGSSSRSSRRSGGSRGF